MLKSVTRVVFGTKHLTLRTLTVSSVLDTQTETPTAKNAPPKKAISKSMRAYLERAKEHQEFMAEKTFEYQIGKRHLANMMGEDPETFTQRDVDSAIEYLFPSGLYEKRARPMMKPPEEIYPQRKAAEFDESGRPYHFLFYTQRPNFYKLLYDIVENINDANKFEDAMQRKNIQLDPNLKLDLAGYQWLQKPVLEKQLVEVITDKDYEQFVGAMERLTSLPYSYRVKDFIMNYTATLLNKTTSSEIPKLQYDEEGRSYITIYECLRKRARAHVTLRAPGNGIVSINGKDITYFEVIQSREQIIYGFAAISCLKVFRAARYIKNTGISVKK